MQSRYRHLSSIFFALQAYGRNLCAMPLMLHFGTSVA